MSSNNDKCSVIWVNWPFTGNCEASLKWQRGRESFPQAFKWGSAVPWKSRSRLWRPKLKSVVFFSLWLKRKSYGEMSNTSALSYRWPLFVSWGRSQCSNVAFVWVNGTGAAQSSISSIWGSCVAMQIIHLQELTFMNSCHDGWDTAAMRKRSCRNMMLRLLWQMEAFTLGDIMLLVVGSAELSEDQRQSNWDVKHRSSSALGLMDGNVFTVYCDLVFWKGEFSSPKAQEKTFFIN